MYFLFNILPRYEWENNKGEFYIYLDKGNMISHAFIRHWRHHLFLELYNSLNQSGDFTFDFNVFLVVLKIKGIEYRKLIQFAFSFNWKWKVYCRFIRKCRLLKKPLTTLRAQIKYQAHISASVSWQPAPWSFGLNGLR